MENIELNRRNFIGLVPSLYLSSTFAKSIELPKLISCNSYNWITFYGRAGKNWGENLETDIAEFAKTGIKAYEPGLTDVAGTKALILELKKNGIAMPSIYVNSVLHEKMEIEKSIKTVLEIANEAKKYGTKIVVTNPSPLQWGGTEIKNDAQLILQAKAMETLGSSLKKIGLTLAYHTHDVELRAGAREFHHVMQNTTAKNVSFCMDVHWIYRGSQNSEVAVFDILKIYGNRIVELHIRQSTNGIWNEVFDPIGDIDYNRFCKELAKMGKRPQIVIEQCLEEKSPNTTDAVGAHIADLQLFKTTFKAIN
jgi:inosose dehydratase